MKKYIALLLVGSLGACNLPTLNVASQVNLNTMQGVVAGYGIVLQAELTYKSLPLCRTGTTPSATNICAKRSLIVRLQSADRVANTAINTAASFISTNPTIDPSQYISAASNAVTALQTILNSAAAGN
jgi:hypothetical protein